MFDHPPVSWDEVYSWVEDVAGIPRDEWRATYYAEQWNVIEKIKYEKGYTGNALTRWPSARNPFE